MAESESSGFFPVWSHFEGEVGCHYEIKYKTYCIAYCPCNGCSCYGYQYVVNGILHYSGDRAGYGKPYKFVVFYIVYVHCLVCVWGANLQNIILKCK